MDSVIAFFTTWWPLIAGIITGLLSITWLIVKMTDTPKDDEVVGVIQRVWDTIRGIAGPAKPSQPVEPTLPGAGGGGDLPGTGRDVSELPPKPTPRDM